MDLSAHSQIQRGSFLIATPEVELGFFFRGVILVCEHTINGSFGLQINRSLDIELPEEILHASEAINPHIGVRASGPVQTHQMMLLHGSRQIESQTLKICEGVYLGGDLQFLQESILSSEGPPLYLCFGYAGWGAGQLEREFLDGQWLLHPASEQHVFHTPPEKLWQTLLREMGGKYATLSMIPEDLSLN